MCNKLLLLLVSLLLVAPCAEAQYKGGQGSGFAVRSLQQVSPSFENTNIYFGGSGQGFSNRKLQQASVVSENTNIYFGGSGQGFSNRKLQQAPVVSENTNIYFGGRGQGAAYASLIANPFPISLLYFKANFLSSNVVALSWATATETNNDYFEVERSSDMRLYVPVAKVKGAGNSSQKLEYKTEDSQPLFGQSYYRLKQVDLYSGHVTYSNTVPVYAASTLKESVSASPNPATDQANIYFNAADEGEALLLVYNNQGQQIWKEQHSANTGLNVWSLNVSKWARGIYIVHIIQKEKKFYLKLMH